MRASTEADAGRQGGEVVYAHIVREDHLGHDRYVLPNTHLCGERHLRKQDRAHPHNTGRADADRRMDHRGIAIGWQFQTYDEITPNDIGVGSAHGDDDGGVGVVGDCLDGPQNGSTADGFSVQGGIVIEEPRQLNGSVVRLDRPDGLGRLTCEPSRPDD